MRLKCEPSSEPLHVSAKWFGPRARSQSARGVPRSGPSGCAAASCSTGSSTCRAKFSIQEQALGRNVERFRGGLAFKAHRLLFNSTLGWRVIKKIRRTPFLTSWPKMTTRGWGGVARCSLGQSVWIQIGVQGSGFRVWSLGSRVEGWGSG